LSFTEDTNILKEKVGVTCERCNIQDCELRKAAPIVLDKIVKDKKIQNIVEELNDEFTV